MVFYEDLHHYVLELDVHDGSHRLLLGSHQRGAKHDAQVGHRHHIQFAVSYDPEEEKQHTPGQTTAVAMVSKKRQKLSKAIGINGQNHVSRVMSNLISV